MRSDVFIMRLLSGVVALCFWGVAQAASPLWTLTPLTATTLSVPSSGTAIVQYQVTNQSTKTRTLAMQSIPGVTQLTTGLGICGSPFVLSGKSSYTLSLQIDGSQLTRPINDGPVVCANGSVFLCYRPASDHVLGITQAPPPDASVSPASGAASGGTGVTLTGVGFIGATDVTFGGVAATNVHVVNSTMITAVTPAHAVGVVDVVITTPSGLDTYTDGYTYKTTAVGQSAFGGTIACLNGGLNDLIAASIDNSTGIRWGVQKYIEAISTSDGAANTVKIVDCLTHGMGCSNPPTPIDIDTYAAGICSTYQVDSQGNTPCKPENACYDDWFLPAGNNLSSSGQLNCLYVNQAAIGGFSSGKYWSSTEFGGDEAYIQGFSGGILFGQNKLLSEPVRCVSTFTP